jgi:hypothetical protein
MKRADSYLDLDGNQISLAGLDVDEFRLVARLRRRASTHPDWCDFDNYWMRAVAEFYDARCLARKDSRKTAAYRISQDLSARLGIAEGMIQPADYRDQLEDLVLNHFPSRRAFCKATGLSEDMLSHVLAGRKDLSLEALTKALERIGYRLRITRAPDQKRTG